MSVLQVLQSFHRAKEHKGSPVKAARLSTKGDDLMFDPRPVDLRGRPAFVAEFRSQCLNYEVSVIGMGHCGEYTQ